MPQVADISKKLARLVLKEDLKLKPYKIPDLHQLLPTDRPKRLKFATWFKGLPKKTYQWFICSDETYFYLTEPINKQTTDYG